MKGDESEETIIIDKVALFVICFNHYYWWK